MKIPTGKSGTPAEGKPCLHTSYIRAYGAPMTLRNQEEPRGCPRQYRKKYVERADYEPTEGMLRGRALHEAMYAMEREPLGPEEALKRCGVEMSIDQFREAVQDLDDYMVVSSPLEQYHTVGVEIPLYMPLYIDEEHGEIWFGGVIDRLGMDRDNTLHLVDYKGGRAPIYENDLAGDVQLMGYDSLVRYNAMAKWGIARPNVISHIDQIKYPNRVLEHRFSTRDLEEWQAWAEMVARRILRDETGDPRINSYCSWCPFRHDCEAFLNLPDRGRALLSQEGGTLEERVAWMDEANEVRKLLKRGIDDVKGELEETVEVSGPIEIGDQVWDLTEKRTSEIDLTELYELVGHEMFLNLAKTSKAEMKRTLEEPLRTKALSLWERVPSGLRLTSRKADDE